MENCKVTLEMRNGKFKIQGENISLQDQAELCGYFLSYIGAYALMEGMPVDEMRDALLTVGINSGEVVAKSVKQGVNE